MSLPDLHGYWKYGDAVVPFRLPLAPVRIVAQGYIPRELPASEINLPQLRQISSDSEPKSAVDQPGVRKSDKAPASSDTKEHEHVIAENEIRVLGSVANRYEAPHEVVHRADDLLSEDLAREFED